ncbi:hypothetical protein OROGR_018982 [Orobanche gracilis]
MLIENRDPANNESVQVDFDDKTSWEYLFKVYWVILKEKLSLTLDELTQAENPWKDVATVGCKPLLSNVIPSAVSVEVSLPYNSTHIEISLPQKETAPPSTDTNVEKLNNDTLDSAPSHNKDIIKPNVDEITGQTSIYKTTDIPEIKEATHEPVIEKSRDEVRIVQNFENKRLCRNTTEKELDKPGINCNTEWATKDLLEFVAHMKNGKTSALPQFDVQTLLLDYIKKNKLRDPRRKSQIICDQRLKNLFGKPRVGHIEMLKLLEFHFLMEDSKKNSFIPAGCVSSATTEMDVDGNMYGQPLPINSRKRKTRKKSDERAPPPNNLNEYAAIDMHNINLIYLRRKLMENLIEDRGNFNNKVIGSIVRIRISSNDQKQDVHRLVQVVGTTKVGEPCEIGDRTADIMLEVLNLDKKEVVSIDAISNQEFSEDECRRLRQSIRCGLVKQFTVGEVQNKAMALRPVRVNDWMEADISRLNHLRDRASENGQYIDRLQLLKSPDERRRRISEIPVVHADPKMSPNYESEEDTKSGDNTKKDEYVRPNHSGVAENRRKHISPYKKDKEDGAIQTRNRAREKINASGSSGSENVTNQVNITNSVTGGRNDQPMQRSGLETASVGNSQSSSIIETEKLWHYRDPNCKIQGPFSMMQLRKWSTTGLFPPDMRIWTNHEQYDSLLLNDALTGTFHLASDVADPGSRVESATGEIEVISEEGANLISGDGKQTEPELGNNVSVSPGNNTELERADESGGSWLQCWDLLKENKNNINSSDVNNDVQACDLLRSSSPERTHAYLHDPRRESESGENNSTGLIHNPITSRDKRQNQFNDEDRVGVASDENLRPLNIDLSLNDVECDSVCAQGSGKQTGNISFSGLPSPTPETVEIEQSDVPMQNLEILELLSPTPRSNNEDQVTEAKPSEFINIPVPDSAQIWSNASNPGLSDVQFPETVEIEQSDVPMQNFEILELLSPTPRFNNEDQVTETKQSEFINIPVPNSAQIWSNASNPGLSDVQLPEVDDEWCAYSPTPAKPSMIFENVATAASNIPNWLMTVNEKIELDTFGEESVSDLLAEVDAMESQGAFHSPTSAMKFARELLEDCKDDCFSSIEEFSRKSDALSSTGEIQLNPEPSSCKPMFNTFDFLTKPSVHSSASSEGETSYNVPVYSGDAGSDFHPSPAPNIVQDVVGGNLGPTVGSDCMDHGWGTVHGNINMVTVQGNVNLVLGGPAAQGMANLGWGTNPGTGWVNPNLNPIPRNGVGSLPWDVQRNYGGERFSSPRDWGGYHGSDSGFGRGRPPWGRQPPPYGGGGGGYSRAIPRGQRVCKFYESGHCKKGAFCDYLHP